MSPTRLFALLPLALASPAVAQWDLHFDPLVPVHSQGDLFDLAWAGGLNFTHVNEVDLNDDGLKDLVLFDKSYVVGQKAVILLRTNDAGTLGYAVTRAYDHVYPFAELHDWVLLRDYNCDGKEDIFTYSNAGFSVFKNISTPDGPAFEMVKYRVNSTYVAPSGAGSLANLFVSQVDLPGIADVDADGDLDVLTFSLLGSYMEYHKNLSMETYGTCDSLVFELRNKCWGYFAENFSNNSVTLNAPCSFNVPNPEIGTNGGDGSPNEREGSEENERAHAGSTITPLDLNDNGVMDLLLGDISYNNLVGLYNSGTVTSAIMTTEDTLFPSYDVSCDLVVFPAAFHLDIDRDGLRDLVVSPNASGLAQDYESMWYYRNTGTDPGPVFEFQQADLFQDRMIELGEGAMPVAFDENGDGLMDLLVANHGYFQNGGDYIGKVALLRNVGTGSAPAFDLVTDDYAGLSASGIGTSMYPAFGDVDGDGDRDMYVGDLQGHVHFFRNTTTGPVAQFQLEQANITDSEGEVLDVGQFATPHLIDLDGDGRIDLVIGERNGNINYYHNTGTANAPVWTLVSEELGGVSTVGYGLPTGHAVPVIFRNEQNELELLSGSESGWLYHYGDIEGNIEGTWTLLDSTFMDIHDGARTGLALHDLTGDGKLDLVVGNFRGGLSFWRSDLISTVVSTGAGRTTFAMYPNPARDHVDLVTSGTPATGDTWSLLNGLGQCVQSGPARSQRTTLDLSGLGEGVYLVRLERRSGTTTQRLVIVH